MLIFNHIIIYFDPLLRFSTTFLSQYQCVELIREHNSHKSVCIILNKMKAFPENSPCLPFHVHASHKTLIFNLNVLSVLIIILGWPFIIHHLRLWKEFPKLPPVPWLHCSPPTAFSHTATSNTHFFPMTFC